MARLLKMRCTWASQWVNQGHEPMIGRDTEKHCFEAQYPDVSRKGRASREIRRDPRKTRPSREGREAPIRGVRDLCQASHDRRGCMRVGHRGRGNWSRMLWKISGGRSRIVSFSFKSAIADPDVPTECCESTREHEWLIVDYSYLVYRSRRFKF